MALLQETRECFGLQLCPDVKGDRAQNIWEIYGLVPGRSHCGFKPGELQSVTGISFVLELES